MNKLLLACSGAFLLVAACGQSGPGGTTPGSAGSSGGDTSGAAGTGNPGAGGTSNPGAGGSSDPGAGGTSNPGAGGTSNPGAGGTSNPGSAGTGNPGAAGTGNPGAAGTGNPGAAGTGNPGAAGSSAGRGGSNGGSSAGTGGSAGSSAGRGGTGGSAGSSAGRGGSGGTGGSAGSGTGGGGGCGLTPDCIVGTAPNGLDGYYWEVTPSGNTALSGTNYPFNMPNTSACPGGAWDNAGYINTRPVINVKGTTGQKYTVHINVRGVSGTRCYEQGTALSSTAWMDMGANNGWYAGGKQYNDSIWNTMEIRVAPTITPRLPMQLNSGYDIYFANATPNSNPSAAGTAQWWCQREATYEVGYDATFQVMGGGTITLVTHDSNCRALQNCGATLSLQTCTPSASRTISMTGVTPAPTNFTQPRSFSLNGTTYYPQWLWIDVTSVTSP